MALAVACATLLAGCGGGGSGADSPGRNGDPAVGRGKAAVVLSAEQLRVAAPLGDALPDGLGGGMGGTDIFEGQKAADRCGSETGTACSGLVAAGLSGYTTRPGDGDVFWDAFSFDTPEDAQVAWKAMAAGKREEEASSDPQPLEVSADADELDAYGLPPSHDYSSGQDIEIHDAKVMMRIGGVVVLLTGYDMPNFELIQGLATVAADRVAKVAQGKNPDA
ncbi:hypothetical protein [Kitasatospora sp. NPDC088783]|uniref:hypothetical protein n=1 Tax=Kitasatospora sp. NPDC088783 TaxID=3364077 RepID=UPI00380906BA